MNIALWLERAGKSHASLPAAALGGRVVLDYGALAMRAARLAAALRTRLRLDARDRVAIVSRNCVEYLETVYAVWHAGLAAVPANAKLHGAELGYILEHSGARACFASAGLDAVIAPFAPKTLETLATIGGAEYERLFATDAIDAVARAPDDLAWLFYTSGTTGRPKGAMLTHRVLSVASHAYAAEVDPVAPGDAILHAAPMSHGSGLYMMAHVARLAVNVVPESGGFEPDEVFRLIGHWARSSVFAAPTMVKRLVQARSDCDPSRVLTLIWGGAPMYQEDAVRALDRFGPRCAQIRRHLTHRPSSTSPPARGSSASPRSSQSLSRPRLAPGVAREVGSSWRAYCYGGAPRRQRVGRLSARAQASEPRVLPRHRAPVAS